MLPLGHIGITIGVVHAVNRKVDLRKVAVLAIAPDLLDKPLGLLFPKIFFNHTHIFGHSLLFSIAILIGFFYFRKQLVFPFLLWASYFGHMALDRIWKFTPHTFLWPFLGQVPPEQFTALERWKIGLFNSYNLIGELIGLSVIIFLAWYYKLYTLKNFKTFIKSGIARLR